MKDTGLTVFVNGPTNEDLTSAIGRFKRRIEKAGVLNEYKQKTRVYKTFFKRLKKQKHGR